MSRRRVLLVDDDLHFAETLKGRLEATGRYEVHTVTEGRRGVEAAHRLAPEIILLNALIPDIDGSVVAAAIKMDPALANVPMAFLTPAVSEEELRQAGSVGGIPLIPKPFGSRKLVEYVDGLLGLQEADVVEDR